MPGCSISISGGGEFLRAHAAFLERFLAIALQHEVCGALDVDLWDHAENCRLAIWKRLTSTIAWLSNLPVQVAGDGTDIDRRGCRPAHRRRVRRAWRRRHPVGAGGRDRTAVRRAIPQGASP